MPGKYPSPQRAATPYVNDSVPEPSLVRIATTPKRPSYRQVPVPLRVW